LFAQLVGPSLHIGLRVLLAEFSQLVGGVFLYHDCFALGLLPRDPADGVDVIDRVAALEFVPGDCVGHGSLLANSIGEAGMIVKNETDQYKEMLLNSDTKAEKSQPEWLVLGFSDHFAVYAAVKLWN